MSVNEEITIRLAKPEDAALLAEIGRKSFFDAFEKHPKMPPEDLAIHINREFGEKIQANELGDTKIVYLIVEAGGKTAGYAKLHKDSREETVTGERCLEIARFYLLQEWIGCGVSQKLMQAVLDFAKENDFDTIWLGVWRFNERAQRFYQKWGFEKIGEHIFMLGNDPQNDWVMQRKL